MVVYNGLPEWDEMRFLLRVLRPTDAFVDIGANVGFYTVLASTIVIGPLLAFEANPRNLEVLREQVSLNQLANAEVFGTALGNSDGELSFFDSGRETGSIASGADLGGRLITVPCSRFDSCIAGRSLPGFVVAKMDVEGCENLILEGASSALEGGRIAIWLFELNEAALRKHGGSGEDLLTKFRRSGYSIHYWDEVRKRLGRQGDEFDSDRENYVACRDVAALERRLAGEDVAR